MIIGLIEFYVKILSKQMSHFKDKDVIRNLLIRPLYILRRKLLDVFMALAIEKGDIGGSTFVLFFLFDKWKMEIIPFGY